MALRISSLITEKLRRANAFWFTLYASVAAFCLYTCIYAFRKTFTAATFEGISYAGYSYKFWLVIFQVFGYALAKFFGIRFIAELKAHSRTSGILLMVAIAGVSWLLFAVVPRPYNMIFLFTNGFPLGLVWGMVFGFLEGRRMTEVLGAALSVSFIFSAGLCRSVGAYLMRDWGVSETWMPLAACGVFFIPCSSSYGSLTKFRRHHHLTNNCVPSASPWTRPSAENSYRPFYPASCCLCWPTCC
jgi:hypothetical protein